RGQPVKNFQVVRNPADKVDVTPTFDPYGTSSGFDGLDPTVQPTAPGAQQPGPVFPTFDPGPNTFSPAPSATPVQTPEPQPSAPPMPETCTNAATARDDRKVSRPDCPYPAQPAPEETASDQPVPSAASDGNPPPDGSGSTGPADARIPRGAGPGRTGP